MVQNVPVVGHSFAVPRPAPLDTPCPLCDPPRCPHCGRPLGMVPIWPASPYWPINIYIGDNALVTADAGALAERIVGILGAGAATPAPASTGVAA